MEMMPSKVSHGGTYAGNRVAAAAAVKTLEIIRDTDALATIHATGTKIQAGVRSLLDAKGLAYQITGHPSMFGIMFTDTVPSEYRDWANTDHQLYDAIAIGMRGARAGRHGGPRRIDLRRLAGGRARGAGPRGAGRPGPLTARGNTPDDARRECRPVR
jgi:4-aminobutyrate aminotransferase-like enzyme